MHKEHEKMNNDIPVAFLQNLSNGKITSTEFNKNYFQEQLMKNVFLMQIMLFTLMLLLTLFAPYKKETTTGQNNFSYSISI